MSKLLPAPSQLSQLQIPPFRIHVLAKGPTGISTSFSPLASSAAPFPQGGDKRGCEPRCVLLDSLPLFLPGCVMGQPQHRCTDGSVCLSADFPLPGEG